MEQQDPSSFVVALEAPAFVAQCVACPDPASYSNELDDVRSILTDLCDVLADVEGVRFIVGGFDDVPWRATVRTDLAVVLEQLPGVLERVRAEQPVELDFFEQGLQRVVQFAGAGPIVTATCTSRQPTWRPPLASVEMTRAALLADLLHLAETFLRVARECCPRVSGHRWLDEWAAAVRG